MRVSLVVSMFLSWAVLGNLFSSSAKVQLDQEDFEGFEDSLLALTKLSEETTLNQFAIRNFRCLERIQVLEVTKKTRDSHEGEFLSTYELNRKADRRADGQLLFTIARKPVASSSQPQSSMPPDVPLIENPFTGYIVAVFTFENRLNSDFKRLRQESVAGRDCVVFAFETVPEISRSRIPILGKTVPLRQKGFVWIDSVNYQVVRLTAKQLKLPSGCRSYEYQIDFSLLNLFNREMSLATHLELNVELKDRSYRVIQNFSHFESL